MTTTTIYSKELIILRQPSYSPGLLASEIWLFDYTKHSYDDHADTESLMKLSRLFKKPKNDHAKTFKKCVERIHLCINNIGDTFEHLIK